MALKITRKPSDYISETAYIYDAAKTSKYFDKAVYNALAASDNKEDVEQYIYGIAGARDKIASTFNEDDYNYLTSPEDKASYTLLALHGDVNSDEYKDAMKYFNQKVQEGINQETYNNLTGLEKMTNTVTGVVGNALNAVYGMIESVLDLGTLAVGGLFTGAVGFEKGWESVKKAAAYDLTRTGAIQNALNEYNYKNTYIGKNKFANFANDVVSGIAQYAVNAIPAVGPLIYWASMGGSAMQEAVEANANIDFYSLMMYGGSATALGYGVEKLSAFALGGSGTFVDKLTQGGQNKALTKLGSVVGKNAFTKMLGAGISEGLEESIEEFFGVVLWNSMVANNYDATLAKNVSFSDVLYAGLVGGTIGFLMQGGKIGTTQKLVKVEDGRIVTKNFAKQHNLKITQDFNKTQSLNINEQLQQLQTLAQTSQIADLRSMYPDLTDSEIQEQHEAEWKDAVEFDEQLTKDIVDCVETLAKVHAVLGDDGFKTVVDVANDTYEKTQQLASAYMSNVTGQSIDTQKITDALVRIYGKGISGAVKKGLTPTQQRLVQNLYNKYGVKAYVVDLGMVPETKGKIGLTISEDTIILDEKVFGQMSEQEILLKIVREELVHTLQFDGNVIKPETLVAIQIAMRDMDDVTRVELGAAYRQAGSLEKLTEAQAKAVAEVLLFDELTVSNMFYSQYSTLSKVYKKIKRLKKTYEDAGDLRKEKNKLRYHELLVAKKMYESILAKKLGTANNVEQAKQDFALSDEDFKKLKDAYLPNENIAPIEKGETLNVATFAKEGPQLSKEAYDVLYNEDGTPKKFYKGAPVKGIKEFDTLAGEKLRTTDKVAWTSSSDAVSKSYVSDKNADATIYELDLSNITNPKVIDAKGAYWNNIDGKTTNDLAAEAIAENKGYDAIIIKNVIDNGPYSTDRALLNPATSIGIIDPTKIKIVKEAPRKEKSVIQTAKALRQEKAIESKAISYLNDYLESPEKITINNPGGMYFANQAKNGAHEIAVADSLQELVQELRDKNYITDAVVKNVESLLTTGEISEVVIKETESGKQRIIAGEKVEPIVRKVLPTNKATSAFTYTQTDVFDYLDEDLTDAERNDTLDKAVEQENNMLAKRKDLKEDVLKQKADTILKIFDNRDISLFQGDVDDPEVERVSDELFDEHPEAFLDISDEEFMALKDYFIVRIGTDPVYGAATNTIIRYGWLNRNDQFQNINEYIKSLYAQWIATERLRNHYF